MRIPLMKHAFLEEKETKKKLAEFIVSSDMFSMGKYCKMFEEQFAQYQQSKYAVLFNSGGSANLALLQALKSMGKLKEGDKVGFSALTWSTNVMPIIQMGLIPVPIDVTTETVNVMANNLKERLQETDLQAFFATNVLGFAGDMEQIAALCKERGILLLEDNCESLGVKLAGKKTGNFGLAATFSFYVAHHMSTIEGGMICTDDEELYNLLKITRANGWDRNVDPDKQAQIRKPYQIDEFYAKYSFFELGFNLRPTEITGFLGIEQLQYLEQNIAIRNRNYVVFESVIQENNELLPVQHAHISRISPFGLVILCQSPELRKKYLERFIQADIEIRPVIAGNMQNQPFYKKYVKQLYALPNTDFVNQCGFYCGNYPELTDEDVETICGCLKG